MLIVLIKEYVDVTDKKLSLKIFFSKKTTKTLKNFVSVILMLLIFTERNEDSNIKIDVHVIL